MTVIAALIDGTSGTFLIAADSMADDSLGSRHEVNIVRLVALLRATLVLMIGRAWYCHLMSFLNLSELYPSSQMTCLERKLEPV